MVETVEKGFFAGALCHLSLCLNMGCSGRSLTAFPSLWAFSLAVAFLSLLSGGQSSSPPPFYRPAIGEELVI